MSSSTSIESTKKLQEIIRPRSKTLQDKEEKTVKEEKRKSANLVQEALKKQAEIKPKPNNKECSMPRGPSLTAISNTGNVKDKLLLFQNA